MRNTIHAFFILLGIFLSVSGLKAQDVHFSQYYNAQMNLTPALTGLIDGDMRYAAAYRSQWSSVPVGYKVVSGAFDMKIDKDQNPNGFFGAGLHLYHDQAGDSKLSSTRLSLVGSYTRRLFKSQYITVGAMTGVTQLAFSMEDLRFDSQWDGVKYVPARPTNETFNNTKKFVPNFSAGINYGIAKSRRTRVNLGGAYYNINKPNYSFEGQDNVELYRRISLYAHGAIQLSKIFDAVLAVNYQVQDPHKETLLSASTRIHLSDTPQKRFYVEPGFAVRFKDALIPTFYVGYNQWQFGVSYDTNVSPFTNASTNLGGPEFTVIYVIKKPEPVESKICPPYL